MQAPHALDRRGARLREAMDLVGTVALLGVVPTLADMATTQSALTSEPAPPLVYAVGGLLALGAAMLLVVSVRRESRRPEHSIATLKLRTLWAEERG
ncbi:MAG: hypothetical protein ACJ8DJ_22720 [Gemmatimonadales bacterium]